MQAYATSDQPIREQEVRALDPPPLTSPRDGDSQKALLDQLLGRLADLVADRLMERTDATTSQTDEWMDARGAAAYLAVHRDTVRKLAAQRAIPAHQDGPRCKLYFRRDELDAWRRSARPSRARAATLRAV